MGLDRTQLVINLTEAHYYALREYRRQFAQRVQVTAQINNMPLPIAMNMAQKMSEELEELIMKMTHEDVVKMIEKLV